MDLFIIQHIHLSIYLSISLSIYLVVIYKILQVVMNQHVFFPLSSNNMLHKVDFIKKTLSCTCYDLQKFKFRLK